MVDKLLRIFGYFAMFIAILMMIGILIMPFIAPLFGPNIKRSLYLRYAMLDDYEAKANNAMRFVYLILWGICIMSWATLFYETH